MNLHQEAVRGLQVQVDTMTRIAAAREQGFAKCRKERDVLLAALRSAEDYFDQRADIKDGEGGPLPNAEMSVLTEIREAIAKATP